MTADVRAIKDVETKIEDKDVVHVVDVIYVPTPKKPRPLTNYSKS